VSALDSTRGRGPGRAAPVEQLVARTLMLGGLAGIALLLLGSGLYAAHGGFHQGPLHLTRPSGTVPPGVFTSVRQVVNGIRARPIDPLAVTALGLVVLMGTPILAVALAIPAFLRAGDRQYAAIAAFVLTLLLVSLTVAGGIH
jgi:uncharacterized membrane protein